MKLGNMIKYGYHKCGYQASITIEISLILNKLMIIEISRALRNMSLTLIWELYKNLPTLLEFFEHSVSI